MFGFDVISIAPVPRRVFGGSFTVIDSARVGCLLREYRWGSIAKRKVRFQAVPADPPECASPKHSTPSIRDRRFHAIQNYRSRLSERGLSRFEVLGRDAAPIRRKRPKDRSVISWPPDIDPVGNQWTLVSFADGFAYRLEFLSLMHYMTIYMVRSVA